jgi:uncharacterized protein (DUF736 family)
VTPRWLRIHNAPRMGQGLGRRWRLRSRQQRSWSGSIPREATRSLNPPSSASPGAKGCRSVVASLKIAIKTGMVAGLETATGDHHASDWRLRTRRGSYIGTIKTLSLNIKARFLPAEPSENKAPNLRVISGKVEIRAARRRTSKDNTVYHAVKLDDPSFSGADLRQPRRGR